MSQKTPKDRKPLETLELHKARFGSFYSKEYTNQYDGHQVRNMMIKVCALALIFLIPSLYSCKLETLLALPTSWGRGNDRAEINITEESSKVYSMKQMLMIIFT